MNDDTDINLAAYCAAMKMIEQIKEERLLKINSANNREKATHQEKIE